MYEIGGGPVVNVRNLRLAPPVNRVKRSGWFITVGTHKKPASDREFMILRDSLEKVLNKMLSDPTFPNFVFFNMEQRGGVWVESNKSDLFRTDEDLRIISKKAEFVVEKGKKQGRIDAHILYEIEHMETRLQFDNHAFQEMLDAELNGENALFAIERVMTDDISKTGQYLRWANPPLYVFWRMTAHNDNNPLIRYMVKNNDPEMEQKLGLVGQVMIDKDAEARRARENALFEEVWREVNG